MPERPQIPQKTVDDLMFENDHTCCICREKGKHVQLHHINGNTSDNNPSNLGVLCLDCHSKVTGSEGLGRKFTPGEINKYKKTWEHLIREKLIGLAGTQRKKGEISYFDLTISEILSMKDNDPRIDEKLKTLYELNIFTGCRDEILDSFFHLALMSSMSQPHTARILAETIPDLFLHLVGPKDVPLTKQYEEQVKHAINLLGIIGRFNGEFSKDIEVIKAACDNLFKLFDILNWYDSKDLKENILSELAQIKDACLRVFEDKKKPLNDGAEYVDKTIERTQSLTNNE
jgi:hypothetical protein